MIEFIFSSRIIIGFIIGLLCMVVVPYGSEPIIKITSFSMGFFATFFAYTYNVLTDQKEDAQNVHGKHIILSRWLVFLLPIIPVPLILYAFGLVGIIVYAFGISSGYIYSSHFGSKKFRFKEVFLVKNLYCAFVAAFFVSFIQMLTSPTHLFNVVSFWFVFLVYMPMEILWDIRDVNGDKPGSTIPSRFGVTVSRVSASILLCILFYMYYKYFPNLFPLVSIPILINIIVLFFSSPNSKWFIFHIPVFSWFLFMGYLTYITS